MSAGEWIYQPGVGESLPAVLRPNGEGGMAYVGQFNREEDARLCAAAPRLAEALEAFVLAVRKAGRLDSPADFAAPLERPQAPQLGGAR